MCCWKQSEFAKLTRICCFVNKELDNKQEELRHSHEIVKNDLCESIVVIIEWRQHSCESNRSLIMARNGCYKSDEISLLRKNKLLSISTTTICVVLFAVLIHFNKKHTFLSKSCWYHVVCLSYFTTYCFVTTPTKSLHQKSQQVSLFHK